jgi:hypothetical protein
MNFNFQHFHDVIHIPNKELKIKITSHNVIIDTNLVIFSFNNKAFEPCDES